MPLKHVFGEPFQTIERIKIEMLLLILAEKLMVI